MTHKGVANSGSKEGRILFTLIPYNVEVCYAADPLKVRVSLWSQNGSPPTNMMYMSTHSNCAFVSAV